jgi:hypothetical protein
VRVATATVSAAEERCVLALRLRRSAIAPREPALEPPDLEPPVFESDRGAELRASIPPLTKEIEELRASLGALRHVVVRSKALEQDREDSRAANRLATVAPLFVLLSDRTSPALELIELACDGKGCRGTLTPSRLPTATEADVIDLARLARSTEKTGGRPGAALTRIGNAWAVGEVERQTTALGGQAYVAWFAYLGGLFGVVSGEGHDDHPHR